MTNENAARVLTALAMAEPEYEALSEEYGAALSGADVPDDFAARVLDVLREDPETAARVERCERNLSNVQSFGAAEILTPEVVLSALVLLSVRLRFKRNLNGKWSFEAEYQPMNGTAMDSIRGILSAVLTAAGEALAKK